MAINFYDVGCCGSHFFFLGKLWQSFLSPCYMRNGVSFPRNLYPLYNMYSELGHVMVVEAHPFCYVVPALILDILVFSSSINIF